MGLSTRSFSASSGAFVSNLIICFIIYYCSTGLEANRCSSTDFYYVSGKESQEGCVANKSASYCTLSTALGKAHKCAVFIIVDNPFILSDEVELSSVYTDVTITGVGKGVVVYCQRYAGFIYHGCTNCGFRDLHFEGCQVNVSSFFNKNTHDFRLDLASNLSTILVFQSTNFEMSNCSISSCLDSAILLVDANGTTNIESSSFTGNESCLTRRDSRSGGIVIRLTPAHAYNSTVQVISCYFDRNINIRPNFSDPYYCGNENGGAMNVVISASGIQIFILVLGSNFSNNFACEGGALALSFYGKDLIFETLITNSLFNNNIGLFKGGAIAISFYEVDIGYEEHTFSGTRKSYGKFLIQSCGFLNNSARWAGALAAYYVACYHNQCENNIDIEVADTEWINNVANLSGFAIGLSGETDQQANYNVTASFAGNCTLYGNKYGGDYGSLGAISVENAIVRFIGGSVTKFDSNTGTALLLRSSSLAIFNGRVMFYNNFGVWGAAILVRSESYVIIRAASDVSFVNNNALVYGGAFYSSVSNEFKCVIEFGTGVFPNNTYVTFVNNTTPGLNQSVFIQTSNPCKESEITVIDIFKFVPQDSFQIIFPPDEVELGVLPQSSQGGIPEFILGESFYFKPVVNDIFNTSSIGIGHMYYDQIGSSGKILAVKGPRTINFDSFTQHINFSVTGPEVTDATNINISFFFLKQSSYHVGEYTVEISIVPCRQGYIYSSDQQKCICISAEEVHCLQDSSRLCLKYHYWYSEKSKSVYVCPRIYCKYMYKQCPPNTRKCLNSTDYCNIGNSSDVCWKGRAGILCSECKDGLSFTLGAFQCVDTKTTCKSKNTVLIIILLLLYWTLYAAVLLVVLSLRLSVGSGFMYGLIYYFSVVSIYTNASALFGDGWVFYVVTICEALTQLTCFNLIATILPYCFSSSWTTPLPHILFQYAGPLFVIALMIIAILVSRFCRLPKKLLLSQSSPIHAICLLVLFSYTSISSTNFMLLIPTVVDGQHRVKWAPSVLYFSRTHMPYALIAIFVELTISLPICFLLLFAPCISKRIDLVKYKLKPIVDEFHACYRTEYRWFAGYYFLARQLVYLINGLLSEAEPQGNTLLVVLNVLIWTIHTTCQPYQRKWLNILDTILLTDLVLISSSVTSQSVDLKMSFNKFVHRKLLPYVLILLPLCCLCGALVVIFGQKLGISRCLSHLWGKVRWAKRPSADISTSSKNNPIKAQANWDDSYYRDDGVREPLLDESFQPDSSKSSEYMHYDSVEDSDRSHTRSTKDSTTSSVRVSQMSSFPPRHET